MKQKANTGEREVGVHVTYSTDIETIILPVKIKPYIYI